MSAVLISSSGVDLHENLREDLSEYMTNGVNNYIMRKMYQKFFYQDNERHPSSIM
jgi:hypothetical protein